MDDILQDLHKKWLLNHASTLFGQNSNPPDLNAYLQTHLGYVVDQAWAKKLQSYAQSHGLNTHASDLSAFFASIHHLDGDCSVLLGPRFKGGDVEKAFVDLVFSTQPPSAENLPKIWDAAQAYYGPIKPRQIRFLCPTGDYETLGRHLPLQADLHLIAGSIETIKATPLPPRYPEIQLKLAENLDFYPRFLETYTAFHAQCSPIIRESMVPEDEAGLKEAMAENLLFEAQIEGQWAGLIAARWDAWMGFKGLLIVEEILATPFRGQGFGSALQRAFIDALDLSPETQVFGTILDANIPSLRTAQRLGRTSRCLAGFYPPESDAF